jgi:hypothetical protein
MPWFRSTDHIANKFIQSDLFSLMNYTQLDTRGVPTFTMFGNVPKAMTNALKQKWRTAIEISLRDSEYAGYDHLEALTFGVDNLVSQLHVLELFQGIYVTYPEPLSTQDLADFKREK